MNLICRQIPEQPLTRLHSQMASSITSNHSSPAVHIRMPRQIWGPIYFENVPLHFTRLRNTATRSTTGLLPSPCVQGLIVECTLRDRTTFQRRAIMPKKSDKLQIVEGQKESRTSSWRFDVYWVLGGFFKVKRH